MIWRCVGCGKPADGKTKPCDCATNVGSRPGPKGDGEQTWWDEPPSAEVLALKARIAKLEAAIKWALGEAADFSPRGPGEGAYWWRPELRKRAALEDAHG